MAYVETEYIQGLKRGARFRTTNYMGSVLSTNLDLPPAAFVASATISVCPIKLSTSIKEASLYFQSTGNAITMSMYLAIAPDTQCQNLTATTPVAAMTQNLISGTFVLKNSTSQINKWQTLYFVEKGYAYVTLFERMKCMIDSLKSAGNITDAQISQVFDLWKLNEGKSVYICFGNTDANPLTNGNVQFNMLSVYGSPSEMHLTNPMIEPIPGANV